jgi:Prp8 binding protein
MKRSQDIVLTNNKKQLQEFHVDKQVYRPIKRQSDLIAPIVLLEGHKEKVLSVQFSPNSRHIASGSHDRSIFLWNAYEDCKNYGVIETGSCVLDLAWSRDNAHLYSCSSDTSVSYWDLEHGERVKRYRGHKGIVNSVSISKRGPEMICTGSDDGFLKIWDQNGLVKEFKHDFPIVSTSFSLDGGVVFCSGVDSNIKVFIK